MVRDDVCTWYRNAVIKPLVGMFNQLRHPDLDLDELRLHCQEELLDEGESSILSRSCPELTLVQVSSSFPSHRCGRPS